MEDKRRVETKELAEVIAKNLCHFDRPDQEADFQDDVEDVLNAYVGDEVILETSVDIP